jgi:hypothetical protein
MISFLDVCNISSNLVVAITYIIILFCITLINIFITTPILKIPLTSIYLAILLQFYIPAQSDSSYSADNKKKLKYSLYSFSSVMIFLNLALFSYTSGGSTQFLMNILLQCLPLVMGISLEDFTKLPQLDVQVSIKK